MMSYSVRDILLPVYFMLGFGTMVTSEVNAFDYHAPLFEELTASISGNGVIGDARNSLIYFSSTGELAFEKNDVTSDAFIALGSTSSQFIYESNAFVSDTGNYLVWDTHPVYFLQYYQIGNALPPGLSKSFVINDLKIHPNHTDYIDFIYVIPEPSSIMLLMLSILLLVSTHRAKQSNSKIPSLLGYSNVIE